MKYGLQLLKDRVQFVATIALLFDLLSIWCALTGSPSEIWPKPAMNLWVSWVLALVVGTMSVIYASRLRRPGWSAGLALAMLCVVGGGCAALADILAHPDGFFPTSFEATAVPVVVVFADVLPPLIAGVSAEFLRPVRPVKS